MGAAAPLASTTETKNRTPRQGSSYGAKRHLLAPADRGPLARPTLSVWSLANGCHTLLPLETSRCLGERPSGASAASRCWRSARLGAALSRFYCHPSASARSRGKKGDHDQALGRSQGGISNKIHLRAEGSGKPMVFVLTAGQRHEQSIFKAVMKQGGIKRQGGGRPKLRPKRVVADKGYNNGKVRGYLRRRGIGIVISRQRHQQRRGPFDKQRYRQRNRVEQLINRLKHFRRVATRYEKLADNYLAMLTIAAIMIWL